MARKSEIKFKEGYLHAPDFLREKPSKEAFLRGLKRLNGIWEKGLKPKDLRRHYFLTWLALANGVLLKQARLLRMHRNALIIIFGRIGFGTRTYKLRRLWLRLAKNGGKKPFHDLFLRFYRRIAKKPVFKATENKALVQLWLSGLPLKVLSAHYVLWAFRKGMTRVETAERLGKTKRTIHRLVLYGSKKGSPAEKWLSPLKPKEKDWYPKWAFHKE